MTKDYYIHLRVKTPLGYCYPRLVFLGTNSHYNVNSAELVDIFLNMFHILEEQNDDPPEGIELMQRRLEYLHDNDEYWWDKSDQMNPLIYEVSRAFDLDLVVIDECHDIYEIGSYTHGALYNSRDSPPEYIIDYNGNKHKRGSPEYKILQSSPLEKFMQEYPNIKMESESSDDDNYIDCS